MSASSSSHTKPRSSARTASVLLAVMCLALAACADVAPRDAQDVEERNPNIRDVADVPPRDDAGDVEEPDTADASDTGAADAGADTDAAEDTAADVAPDIADSADTAVDVAADVAPDSVDTSDTAADAPPEVSDATDTAPDTSDATDTTDALDVADTTDTSDAADAPDSADTTDVADTTDATDVTDTAPDVVVGPADRGSYLHGRLVIGGLRRLARASFAPQSDLLLMAEGTDVVHVYRMETATNVAVSLRPSRGAAYWEDVSFSPDGDYALLLGQVIDGSTKTGVVYRFDAVGVRDGTVEPAAAFTQVTGLPAANAWAAVTWPPTNEELPVLLSRNEGSSYNFALRRFDPATNTVSLIGAQASSAGCQDVEYVNNELGGSGLLVVCGINGDDIWYWTWVGGVGEWRTGLSGLGNGNRGNTSRLVSHPSRSYALLVGWAGRKVYRFEGGRLSSSASSPTFSTLPIWTAAFSPDGRRALIAGQISVADNGTVLEYRHDLYTCSGSLGSATCPWTDVSVLNFSGPPWAAPDYAQINDIAWRTDCDGGVMVAGYSNYSTNWGMVVTFELEGGQPCW